MALGKVRLKCADKMEEKGNHSFLAILVSYSNLYEVELIQNTIYFLLGVWRHKMDATWLFARENKKQ